MAKGLITDSILTGIASAIRTKLGVLTTYKPSQMAAAIASIPQGITPTGTIEITENGPVDVTQYANADVNVESGSPTIQSLSVTQNGTYNPPSGVDGYSPVTVNVSGGGSSPVIYSNDRTLAVYIDTDNNRLVWYFMGFTKPSNDVAIPPEIFISQLGTLYSKAYDSDKETQIGQIGFYNSMIRSWTPSTAQTLAGTFWGVVYSNGGQGQTNPYSDPPQ